MMRSSLPLLVVLATVNHVTGLLLPQSVLPGIAGPPLPSASSASAWGTAAGALFAWEPFDLGLRGASIRGAEAAVGKHAPTRR